MTLTLRPQRLLKEIVPDQLLACHRGISRFLLRSLFLWLPAAQLMGSTASAPAHNAVVVLVDSSGSMRTSDPSCARADALSLLVSLLPDGDRVALAEFGDSCRPRTRGFLPLNAATRAALAVAASSCSSSDRNTDIAAALVFARDLVAQMRPDERQAYRPAVLLLTDGKHNGAGSLELAEAGLMKVSAPVFGVGLGAEADVTSLQGITSATGGELFLAKNSGDLTEGYLSFGRLLTGRWLISDDQVTAGELRQVLPGWVRDWRGVLLAPGRAISARSAGSRVSDRADSGERPVFHGIGDQLRIQVPVSGRLIVDAAGDLRILAQMPSRLTPGMTFKAFARIAPAGPTELGRPAFLRRFGLILEWRRARSPAEQPIPLYDDGLNEEGAAGDGNFGRTVVVPPSKPDTWLIRTSLLPGRWPEVAGTVSFPVPAIAVARPGLASRVWSTLTAKALPVRLENRLDVSLPLLISGATGPQAIELKPGGQVECSVSMTAAGPFSRTGHLSASLPPGNVLLVDQGISAPSPLALLGPLVVLLAAIAATFVFPRGRVEGSTLRVTFTSKADAPDPPSISASIGRDGYPILSSADRDRLRDVGQFSRRSGMWNNDFVYTVPTSMNGRIPRNAKPGTPGTWRLRNLTIWEVDTPEYELKFTFTPRK
jgi:hypothetical protein